MSLPQYCIVMATHNGARFLKEQLDSFETQTHRPSLVIISDDASTDETVDIIRDFSRLVPSLNVHIRQGPCQGSSANFLSLIRSVKDFHGYVAFSDQDDVWFPEKMERAVHKLEQIPDYAAALYGSATMICDQTLRPIRKSVRNNSRLGFQNALTQNFAGGNTMVLNPTAFAILAKSVENLVTIPAHDWWTYQIVSGANARVLFDPEPTLFYRQHDRNVIGSNDSMRSRAGRLREAFKGTYKHWNTDNINALLENKALLSAENLELTRMFAALREPGFLHRARTLKSAGFYRRGTLGQVGLWLVTLIGRI